MIEKIRLFLNHQRYEVISCVVIVVILISFLGCQSETTSILDPSTSISRDELSAEVNNFMERAKIRFADLDRQDEIKQILLNNALLYSATGTLNPVGVVTTLAAVFGIGATVDNVRRRKNASVTKPTNSNDTS